MTLNDSVEKLYLVGPTMAKRLNKLGIITIKDLLYHFPFRYDDFSLISPISKIQAGGIVTIQGKIEKITSEFTKNHKQVQKATISDGNRQIQAIWFNQPFLAKTIKIGDTYNFSGKADWFGRELSFISPEYEIIKPTLPTPTSKPTIHNSQLTTIHTGRLVPIYPETYGVSSKWLRARIKTVLEYFIDQIEDFLPPEIVAKEILQSEKVALFSIHFPDSWLAMQNAKKRLSFDELLLIQLAGLLRKKEWEVENSANAFAVDENKLNLFLQSLPFSLTNAQKRCSDEILNDLKKNISMNRLLQGDVGSGKTIVASLGCYVAYLNGFKTLFMAPTEILANQHHKTLKKLFEPLGIKVELATSSTKNNNETRGDIIVGTHALLYQDFDNSSIGFVVIDEQHRFGVEQRALLTKKGKHTHLLTMTATPIPRTIALTIFGDLNMSVIDEMPIGRQKVKTWVVPKEKRQNSYEWIRKQVKDTIDQAFIVCPLIEESETLSTVKAASKEFENLKKLLPDLRLGLIHGRIKSKEKEETLLKFRNGEIDVLVATPVVEVGIDIPNATIMLIEAADRFGLAQLHQLRGRVGRNDRPAYCFLFTENENPVVLERLKSMEKTHIGFELAEIDLKLRGPGEIYGTRQHGFPDLKIATFSDLNLIQKTRETAEKMLITYGSQLASKNPLLKLRLENYKIETVSN